MNVREVLDYVMVYVSGWNHDANILYTVTCSCMIFCETFINKDVICFSFT